MSEKQYLELLKDVLENGKQKDDRTGTGTRTVFHRTLRFNLQDGFPLLTTKFVPFKSVLAELLWFISGSTNNNDLLKLGSTIWNEWASKDGELGEIYGYQWRDFGGEKQWVYDELQNPYLLGKQGFDQLEWLIEEIKNNPNSRRLYVTSANPLSRENQSLDCCHNYFQVQILDGKLNLYFQMRSTDVFLGLPFNIASYALLAHMLAAECGYNIGELVYSGVDVHLYENHLEQAKIQSGRKPLSPPILEIKDKRNMRILDCNMDSFDIIFYEHQGKLSAPVAV